MRGSRPFNLLASGLCAAVLSAHDARAQSIPSVQPANPNASPEARVLLAYLHSIFGKRMLTGQMEAPWGIDEISYVNTHTGKLPALRGQDLINEGSNNREINEALKWWQAGGITTIMWHWGAPTVGEGYQASLGTIDVNRCFIEGSNENREMWSDLERIADHLAKLRDAKVPVIWRPMHECSGGWFWWDKGGGEAFQRLWRTMFDYFTKERGLDNLIWFLGYDGSPNAAFNPGKDYYDLVGGDTYGTNSPFAGIYNSCKGIHGAGVPIALHECGLPPDPDAARSQNVLWAWFMVWHTGHLEGLDRTNLRNLYTHDLTLSRDELPRFSTLSVSLASRRRAPGGPGLVPGFASPSAVAGFDPAGRRLAPVANLVRGAAPVARGSYFLTVRDPEGNRLGRKAVFVGR